VLVIAVVLALGFGLGLRPSDDDDDSDQPRPGPDVVGKCRRRVAASSGQRRSTSVQCTSTDDQPLRCPAG